MKNKHFLIFPAILIAAFSFFLKIAYSFDNYTNHRNLANLSAELYNSKHPDKKISKEELEWIKEGAKDEDMPFLRCANHFYDPINRRSLIKGSKTAIEWTHSSESQSFPGMGGVFTWEQAKYSFADKDREKAFKSLGHVLHLVEDMAVPAHVRDDAHVFKSDLFEEWARDFGGNIPAEETQNCSGLDICMDELAEYTNRNFLSVDTIDFNINTNSYPKVWAEDKFGDLSAYIAKKDPMANIEYKFLALNRDFTIQGLDKLVFSDYWKILSPKAASYGARIIELFMEEAEKESISRKPATILSRIGSALRSAASAINIGKEKTEYAAKSSIRAIADFASDSISSLKQIIAKSDYNQEEEKEKEKKEQEQKEEEIKNSLGIMYNGRIIEKSGIESNIKPKEEKKLQVKIKNTGISDWSNGQISLNITTDKTASGKREDSAFYSPAWITRIRPAETGGKIARGDIAVLEFPIQAPEREGIYSLELRPVFKDPNNQFHWLGKDSVSWDINVEKPAHIALQENILESFSVLPIEKEKEKENQEDKAEENREEEKENKKEEEKSKENKEKEEGEKEEKIIAGLPSQGILFAAPYFSLEEESGEKEENQEEEEEKGEDQEEEEANQANQEEDLEGSSGEDEEEKKEEDNSNSESGSDQNSQSNSESGSDPDPIPELPPSVIISEIAWAGTETSSSDEWIELYNASDQDIDLSGWVLEDETAQLNLDFSKAKNKEIKFHSYYLIERGDDNTISDISADFVSPFSGGLNNSDGKGERLILRNSSKEVIDEINFLEGWPAGDNKEKTTMERISPDAPGNNPGSWKTNNKIEINGKDEKNISILGTPKKINSASSIEGWPENQPEADPDPAPEPEPAPAVEIAEFSYIQKGYPNSEIQMEISEGKAYYGWSTAIMSQGNTYNLFLASSNLNGTDFKQKTLLSGIRNIGNLKFIINNKDKKAYFAWIELNEPGLMNVYMARISLDSIQDENSAIEETAIAQEIPAPFGGTLLELNEYGGKIIITWTSADKTINISETQTEEFSSSSITNSIRSGIYSDLNSIITGKKQYISWSEISFNPNYTKNIQIKSIDLETGEQEIQTKTDRNISSLKISESGDGDNPILFWTDWDNQTFFPGNNKNIRAESLQESNPAIILNSLNNKRLFKADFKNENYYLLYQETDINKDMYYTSYYHKSINLLKLDKDLNATNIFSYSVPDDVSEFNNIHSSWLYFSGGVPYVSWIKNNSINGYSFYLARAGEFE